MGLTVNNQTQTSLEREYAQLCRDSPSSPDVFEFLSNHRDARTEERLAVLLFDQAQRWRANRGIPVEDYLQRCPELSGDNEGKLQLVLEEYGYLEEGGRAPCLEAFVARFPSLANQLRAALADDVAGGPDVSTCSTIAMEAGLAGTQEISRDAPAAPLNRYFLRSKLGEGAFGSVHLGHDTALDRYVAIKLAKPELLRQPGSLNRYLAEARVLARLDHPAIVPVYDVTQTSDGCCIVSKYIDGTDLAAMLRDGPMAWQEAVRITAVLAEALDHAHRRGIVHRDIKPSNILIDRKRICYLADFGVALINEALDNCSFAGTPAYMSPEQARGEAHLVDARSDLFGVGAVFYEMLTGQRAFRGESIADTIEHITKREVIPPRELVPELPGEVDRICRKCLAKRASERYASAQELAEDLQSVSKAETGENRVIRLQAAPEPGTLGFRGLRPLDEQDAEAYLDLLPGPRDRAGLPPLVSFWKSALDASLERNGLRIGVIYGPTGCGKSSLLKAGLLPRLSTDVHVVYADALSEDFEHRLRLGLRRQLPQLPESIGLVQALAAIRRGDVVRSDRKVLIVLDQFEQWLRAHPRHEQTELATALRQCDGLRLQSLILVRDDFWLSLNRFMQQLDVPLQEGENATLFDLFDPAHARHVLARLGQALGRLPAGQQRTPADTAFLDRAISELSEDGRIVSVRLAIFAEMMKDRPWHTASLKRYGGATGIAEAFLEETFGERTAKPNVRRHLPAARRMLHILLPPVGRDIRGTARSRNELANAAGYQAHASDLDELLKYLDQDLRLITPVESEMNATPCDSKYQLTHDYLVPALRNWLARKQRETFRGRAQLRLDQLATAWTDRPEVRNLPNWWELPQLWFWGERRNWTAVQRRMMRKATRHHGSRIFALLAGVVLLAMLAYETLGRIRTHALIDQLQTAEITDVPKVAAELIDYRRWALPALVEQQAADPQDERLHWAASFLADLEDEKSAWLLPAILEANLEQFRTLMTAIKRFPRNDVKQNLIKAVEAEPPSEATIETMIPWASKRANAALAVYLLNEPHHLWQLLGNDGEHTTRALLIDSLSRLPVEAHQLVSGFAARDSAQKRAVLFVIGSIGAARWSKEEQRGLINRLDIVSLYRNDPDPGLRAAIDWLLTHWKCREVIEQKSESQPRSIDTARWYTTSQGHTMVVLGPGQFQMGSPDNEFDRNAAAETLHCKRISRRFAISMHEVTIAQFKSWSNDETKLAAAGDALQSDSDQLPMHSVTWNQAVRYCNWLSEQEKIPRNQWCYSINGVPVSDVVRRVGYRLPTEAEWEYACRAGSPGPWAFGYAMDLMPDYAWIPRNSILGLKHPVGTKRPNDLGLFDMYGNADEWCHDLFEPYTSGECNDDVGGPPLTTSLTRVLRGKAAGDTPPARSAFRQPAPPEAKMVAVGFRIARTVEVVD